MAEVIRNNNETKDSRLVFKAQIARQLLKKGNTVIDIKADKANNARTVFVFRNDEKFQEDFNEILNDLADAKAKERKREKKESVEKKED